MTRRVIVLSVTGLLCTACSAAFAQNAPPTYQGDPDVYKVIFEDKLSGDRVHTEKRCA